MAREPLVRSVGCRRSAAAMAEPGTGALPIVGQAVPALDVERLDQQRDDQAVIAHPLAGQAARVRFLLDRRDHARW